MNCDASGAAGVGTGRWNEPAGAPTVSRSVRVCTTVATAVGAYTYQKRPASAAVSRGGGRTGGGPPTGRLCEESLHAQPNWRRSRPVPPRAAAGLTDDERARSAPWRRLPPLGVPKYPPADEELFGTWSTSRRHARARANGSTWRSSGWWLPQPTPSASSWRYEQCTLPGLPARTIQLRDEN